MRSMLGRTAGACLAGTVLMASVVVGVVTADAPSAAAAPCATTTATEPDTSSSIAPTTEPETSSPTTTTEPCDTTTTTAVTTTTATTTTAVPPVMVAEIDDPVVAAPTRVLPAVQVAETLPPPPTTTTTTLPPEWLLPAGSGEGRRVVYRKTYPMRVWTVEADGNVSKTHLVSGRATWNQPTPGTYSVFSRSGYTCNINNPHICWRYMVRFTRGPDGDNIGFHEIPTNTSTGAKLQSESQLGLALSGGCVRQATPDAQWMWDWAPVGTKVVVLP